MTDTLDFDEDFLGDLERLYRTESMTRRRAFVRERLGLDAGDTVLSIGTGPGFEPRGFARVVGEGGRVVGVDASLAMLAASRDRCSGFPQVAFQVGDATDLPVDDGAIGKAAAVQVYEYVTDVDAAVAELYRVLAPGGRAVVFDSDWGSLTYDVDDQKRSRRVLGAYDDHCLHPRIALTLRSTLERADFEVIDVDAFTHVETVPGGVGEQMASFVADFAAARSEIPEAVVDAWMADIDERIERDEFFFSFSQYAFVVGKPGR